MNKERRKAVRQLKRKLAEVHGHVLTICDEEKECAAVPGEGRQVAGNPGAA